jgi:hypothetical protein
MIVDATWSEREGMPRAALLAVPDADAMQAFGKSPLQLSGQLVFRT